MMLVSQIESCFVIERRDDPDFTEIFPRLQRLCEEVGVVKTCGEQFHVLPSKC